MLKNYVLIVEYLPKEVGIYGVDVTKEEYEPEIKGNSVGDTFRFEWSDLVVIVPYVGPTLYIGKKIYKKFMGTATIKNIQKVADIKPRNRLLEQENREDESFFWNIIQSAITIPSKLFKGNYDLYEEDIFDGCFRDKEAMKMILPTSKDTTLFILSKGKAEKIFINKDNIQLGLNIFNFDTKEVFPIINFQENRWKRIEAALRYVFSNLGLKRLSIKEVKTLEGSARANHIANSGKVEHKHRYEINYEETWSQRVYNPSKAKDSIFMLQDIPIFMDIAKDLIDTPQECKKIKRREKVEFMFGMEASVLYKFNLNTIIDCSKELDIEMEF